jgi:hypothetical protein
MHTVKKSFHPIVFWLAGILAAAALAGFLIMRSGSGAVSQAGPREALQAFYDSWISYAGNPLEGRVYANAGRATPDFIRRTDAAIASFKGAGGYDPILCAQDVPESVEVLPLASPADEGKAELSVRETFGGKAREIRVAMVAADGGWKVDSIRCNEVSGSVAGTLPSRQDQDKIFEYVRTHISELAPYKEQAGGKFFLTGAQFLDGDTIEASYEDGHNAYKASAHARIDAQGNVQIADFEAVQE